MKAIVCMTDMKGIGYKNRLPWKLRADLLYFKYKTIGNGRNAIVMGFNTFKSIGYRGLPNRRNYVMTRNPIEMSRIYGSDVVFESNVQNILLLDTIFEEVFVIGGESIYSLFEPYYSEIYVTHIKNFSAPVDTFFNVDLTKYKKKVTDTTEENNRKLEFCIYKKKSFDELV